jgi:hypothetical protein
MSNVYEFNHHEVLSAYHCGNGGNAINALMTKIVAILVIALTLVSVDVLLAGRIHFTRLAIGRERNEETKAVLRARANNLMMAFAVTNLAAFCLIGFVLWRPVRSSSK